MSSADGILGHPNIGVVTVFLLFAFPFSSAIIHIFNKRKSGGWVDFWFNNRDHQGGQKNADLLALIKLQKNCHHVKIWLQSMNTYTNGNHAGLLL